MDHDALAALAKGGAKESDGARKAREEMEDLHLQVFGHGSGARLLAVWSESVDGSVFQSSPGDAPAVDGMAMALMAAQRDGRHQFVRAIKRRMERARRRHGGGTEGP